MAVTLCLVACHMTVPRQYQGPAKTHMCIAAADRDTVCGSECFPWNEANNALGPGNTCSSQNHCQCDGARTCSGSGFCSGFTRNTDIVPYINPTPPSPPPRPPSPPAGDADHAALSRALTWMQLCTQQYGCTRYTQWPRPGGTRAADKEAFGIGQGCCMLALDWIG
jgi:hypothetical protein